MSEADRLQLETERVTIRDARQTPEGGIGVHDLVFSATGNCHWQWSLLHVALNRLLDGRLGCG